MSIPKASRNAIQRVNNARKIISCHNLDNTWSQKWRNWDRTTKSEVRKSRVELNLRDIGVTVSKLAIPPITPSSNTSVIQ